MNDSRSPYTLAAPSAAPPIAWGYWVVENQFLAGAYPGSLDQQEHRTKVQTLLNAGIRTIINLTEPGEQGRNGSTFVAYEPLVEEFSQGLPEKPQCLRFAVPDRSVPSRQVMTSILEAIDASLAARLPVYVHCWGGIGRTGAAVGCWMLRHGLATRETVLEILDDLRQQDRDRGHRPAPENAEQCRFVRDW